MNGQNLLAWERVVQISMIIQQTRTGGTCSRYAILACPEPRRGLIDILVGGCAKSDDLRWATWAESAPLRNIGWESDTRLDGRLMLGDVLDVPWRPRLIGLRISLGDNIHPISLISRFHFAASSSAAPIICAKSRDFWDSMWPTSRSRSSVNSSLSFISCWARRRPWM
jgi:hypothetical protein